MESRALPAGMRERLGETGMNGRNEPRGLRWRRAAALTAGLSLWGGALFAQDESAPKRTKEAYINKRGFEIPVLLTKAPDQIKQLHLWVSADQGATWKEMASAPPARKKFIFTAPTDGEYQFTLAHEKLDGTMVPADVKSRPAGMRVVVDTLPPEIRLKPIRTPADQKVGVAWTIDEPNPDLATFKLKLKTTKELTWHELNAKQTIEGKLEWPTDPGDDYIVQVSLSDRAGNQGTKSLDINGYGGSEPISKGIPPIAKADLPTRDPLEEPAMPRTAARPAMGMDDILEPAPPKMSRNTDKMEAPRMAVSRPPTTIDALNTPEPPKMDRKPATAAMTSSVPASSMASMEESKRPTPNVFDPTRTDLGPQKPVGDEDVIAQRTPKKAEAPSIQQVAHQVMKPVEPKIKLVGSPRFRMKYNVAGVGPSGVGAVELWMTQDNGTKWEKIGADPDLESPIDVNLPGDGKYGLTVVVKNKAGNGQRPPVAGEQPQIRVDVDTDAPIATLKNVTADPSSPRDSMNLAWETEDKHPAERAVDLYFSHDPDRGWYKIAGGLPPSGTYSWKVPYGVPHQVYFMLMARDQAANVEKIFSQKPVIVDLSTPEGKIDGIVDVLPVKKLEDSQN
jgi:hypothetical protein